jgi:FkbM family methyltransferase
VSLFETRARFAAGALDKFRYVQDMYNLHARLFEYAEFLRGTGISRIEIADGDVIMTERASGVRMLCIPNDMRLTPMTILNFGEYERAEFDVFLGMVAPRATILDIGANIGWYSLNIARRFPDVTIHAFEPIPSSFGYFKRNVELNGFANIHLHNHGFSSKEEELPLYFYPDVSGASSGANILDRPDVQRVVCAMKTLDGFMARRDLAIDLIKCDVEGAELFVFQGGMETLRTQRPILFTEMLRKWSAKFGYSPNEIIDLLGSIGYECFRVVDQQLVRLPRMEDSIAETNFFFLHPARHAAIIRERVGQA